MTICVEISKKSNVISKGHRSYQATGHRRVLQPWLLGQKVRLKVH